MPITGDLLASAMAGIAFVGCAMASATPAPARNRGAAARGRGQRQAGQDRRRACPLHRPGGRGADQSSAGSAGPADARHQHAHRGDGRAGHRRRGAEHQPLLVSRRARRRRRADQGAERDAGGILRRQPGSLRRLRNRGVAASRPRRGTGRTCGQEAGLPRRRRRRQRRRRGTGQSRASIRSGPSARNSACSCSCIRSARANWSRAAGSPAAAC